MESYLVHWIASSLAVMLTAYLVPGFRVDSFLAALMAALVIGFVNMFIWPLLVFLTLPLTLLTFGLFLLVVNGLSLKIAAALTPGFSIKGIFPAIMGAIVLSIIGYLVRMVFYHPSSMDQSQFM